MINSVIFLLQKSSRIIGTGTFGCGTFIIEGEDFMAENITFENSAPQVHIVLFPLAETDWSCPWCGMES